jgi:hypothetical protein
MECVTRHEGGGFGSPAGAMNSTVAVAIGAGSVAIGAAVLCMVSRRFRGEASKLLAEEQRVIVSVKTGR